jgi:hypothetical protein
MAYRDIVQKTPNEMQRALIAEAVEDADRWITTIKEWLQSGWNPLNVKGMVERYKEPRSWKGRNNGPIAEESSFGLRGDGRISPLTAEEHAEWREWFKLHPDPSARRPDLPDVPGDALPASAP